MSCEREHDGRGMIDEGRGKLKIGERIYSFDSDLSKRGLEALIIR